MIFFRYGWRVDWINMGGYFIHHTDVPNTIRQIKELGKCAPSSEELSQSSSSG
jgi:hypothetical protein